MPKYRRKPLVYEAIQFIDTAENISEISSFVDADISVDYSVDPPVLRIQTANSIMPVKVGDYIIKGVDGEYYVCKQSVFEKSYERID